MVSQERQSLGIQFVDSPRAFAPVAHKPGLLQHAKVLRNRGTRHRQSRRQFVYRARVGSNHFENGEARGITERGESVLYVSAHLR